MLLSVVIPLLNEEGTVALLHAELVRVLGAARERFGVEHEIVYVSDGSTDGTFERLMAIAREDERVRVVALSRNFGHEAALAAGIDRAGGDAVVIMDGDLQDPPELILEMIARWRDGVRVVYAQRRSRAGDGALKRAAIHVFYRVLRSISDVDIPLDTGNFRLMDRRVVDVLRACRENPRYMRGLVPWAGFRQEPVLFERAARAGGESKYTLRRLVALAFDGIFSFSQAPLRAASWIGSVVVVLSVVGALVVIVEKVAFNSQAPRGFAFLACAVFFMGGVQLFVLGMVAQYLGFVFRNVQGRPLYVIAEDSGPTSPAPRDAAAQVVVRVGARAEPARG